MPLQQIPVSSNTVAENTARQLVQLATQTAQRIATIRKNGVAVIPATPARTLPTGQVIPGRDEQPGATPEAIDGFLGPENVAIFDAAASAFLPALDASDAPLAS